jgi:hypothetical protein
MTRTMILNPILLPLRHRHVLDADTHPPVQALQEHQYLDEDAILHLIRKP